MRYLCAVVVVALLALLGGGGVDASLAFWRKYGINKMLKDCFASPVEDDWVSLLQGALAHCNEQEALGALPDAALPANVDWNKATDSAVRFTAAKIENLKQKLNKRVQVFRCVFQKVEITDSTFEVNTSLLLAPYRSMNLTDTFYKDMEQGIHHCHQFTQCMPVDTRSDLAVPADVIRTKAFVECEFNFRYLACLKQDLKPTLGTYDLSGLDGTLDFLPSDEARAAAVLLDNDKVGYPDYQLFE